MCEERTDDASRNFADTKARENHVEACAKKFGRASPFLSVLSATLTTFEAKESINR